MELPLSTTTADNFTTPVRPSMSQPLPVQASSQHTVHSRPVISHIHEPSFEQPELLPRQHCPTQTSTTRPTFQPRFSTSHWQLPKPHFQLEATPPSQTEVRSQLNPNASFFISESPALRSDATRPIRLDNNQHCSSSHHDDRQFSDDHKGKSEPIADITKFLLKKDLILSRITKYDDNPSFYLAWKLTFQSVMKELSATASEELDLLIRWLGPESSRQAATIRKCNASDPVTAIGLVWERLEERFGSPELIESSLKRNIATFSRIGVYDYKRLYNLADLAAEIDSVKRQPQYAVMFGYFDSPTGINSLVAKLPPYLQEKWTVEATKYKKREATVYPPFTFFVKFLKDLAKMENDPSFNYENTERTLSRPSRTVTSTIPVTIKKTEAGLTCDSEVARCPFHHTKHLLNDCIGFRSKPLEDRKKFIMTNGICIRCCGPKKHRAKNCNATIQCSVCKSSSHPAALHNGVKVHEGEETKRIVSTCTQVCGTIGGTSKSCAKIVPARIYPEGLKQQARVVYAMIDDQSNHCLASCSFFDAFNQGGPVYEYTLASCSGKFVTSGRRAPGFIIESMDETCTLKLPTLIECAELPNDREEIPSPHIAEQYTHLQDIADAIPELIDDADIEILIGRDLIAAHVVEDQRYCNGGVPYAQKLPLGWVIIGSVCLDALHVPDKISVNKTSLLGNGRPSLFEPCDSKLIVKDNIFAKTELDETTALSIDDRKFLNVMDSGFQKDPDGRWTAPLPFRSDKPPLPDNKQQAISRAESLDRSLRRNPVKMEHVSQFMNKIFDRGHAEEAPSIPNDKERWYLPMFGVYHRRKKDSIRMVFDSSARFRGLSLNDVLLKGPDVYNNLQGILLRFRRERVAVTTDVEQMFHNFRVHAEYRDHLRFLWHPENDLSRPLAEYRMTVHVFGNRPSPAVATYGLRRCVADSDPDVRDFVSNNFYVDDGLISCPSDDIAVDLIQRTQYALKEGGQLRLHKIASNSKSVLRQFKKDDLVSELKNLDIGEDDLPIQRSLGLSWNINDDAFTFKIDIDSKPFTRRGVLSTINSLFDPLGFTCPVIIQGKMLLREMMTTKNTDWDEPLDGTFLQRWTTWVHSLHFLEDLSIPRMYSKFSIMKAFRVQVHIFADASKDAIAAVAYLKVWKDATSCDISFLFGKAKVAPAHGHTIPRLELCSAVLAVERAELIKEQLGLDNNDFWFYTDSQVALGYIANDARRFYVYVANRVSRVRSFSKPDHWCHVPTNQNPEDLATRTFDAQCLPNSIWITGPDFLNESTHVNTFDGFCEFPVMLSDSDKEVRPNINVKKSNSLDSSSRYILPRFEKFSKWSSLVNAIAILQHIVKSKKIPCEHSQSRWHYCAKSMDADSSNKAKTLILKAVQEHSFAEEIRCLSKGLPISNHGSISNLSPFLDSDGLLRVGGRLSAAKKLIDIDIHPIIVPRKSHVAVLLVRFCHDAVFHQGRHLTEGKLRSEGYWIIGAKRLISSEIHHCVTCRKLRGSCCGQKMANLPDDRLTPGPPFTFVGVDAFGPWEVMARRTRGGVAKNKRWAILFTCLVSRGIHVELVEELSTSSFINALRRFTAIRGPVRQFRSDRGTNFVGAVNELNMLHQFVEGKSVQKFLRDKECVWLFNPPYASHFGGAWERMIGIVRRILDGVLLLNSSKNLTHETLSTFLAEVCAVVNSRPLTPITEDADHPTILTPATILTHKTQNLPEVIPPLDPKEMYKSQWRHVQILANLFWKRWVTEYISSLQPRRKWMPDQPDLKVGDVVLLKDVDSPRNMWPMAVVNRTFPSTDGHVREVEIRVHRDNNNVVYTRPVHKLVPLVCQ